MILLAAAAAATALDAISYFLVITPGYAIERNPIIAGQPAWLVLLAKALLVIALGAMYAVYRKNPEAMRIVRRVLLVAVAVGTLGAASTVMAA